MNKKNIILMFGSDLSVGGGVVSVVQNYLNYTDWGIYEIIYIPTHINGSAIKKILFFLKNYIRSILFFLKRNVSIIHLHLCDGGPFYRKSIIMFTAKFFGIKTILHHHTDYIEFFSSLSGSKRNFVKKALRTADINIVLGNHQKKVIHDFEPEANCKIVHNAVLPYENLKYNPDGKYIMFLGWILERKGVLDLLKAVKLIDNQLDNQYKVILCGQCDNEMKKKIDAIGINHRIAHIGWIKKEEKEKYFSNTIVNVLPSYREGMPMTILETMAFGIPNIATDISTISEVIKDGINGFLLKSHNINELANRIEKIVFDSNLRKEFSQNSYKTIKSSFSIPNHISKIIRIYDQLL